jgi:hypothetical protein
MATTTQSPRADDPARSWLAPDDRASQGVGDARWVQKLERHAAIW